MDLYDVIILIGIFLEDVLILVLLFGHLFHRFHHFGFIFEGFIQSL